MLVINWMEKLQRDFFGRVKKEVSLDRLGIGLQIDKEMRFGLWSFEKGEFGSYGLVVWRNGE